MIPESELAAMEARWAPETEVGRLVAEYRRLWQQVALLENMPLLRFLSQEHEVREVLDA